MNTTPHPTTLPIIVKLSMMEKIVGVAVILTAICGNYVIKGYRIGELEKRLTPVVADVEEMKLFGHGDHEKRITKLENQKADQLAAVVEKQSTQIEKLAIVVSKDHDDLVRIMTLMEAQQKSRQ